MRSGAARIRLEGSGIEPSGPDPVMIVDPPSYHELMARERDPDRMMACFGALAAWGLLTLVVVQHLVGFRNLAGSLFFPSPLTLLVPLIVLPILAVGVGLFVAASFYTIRERFRPFRGVILWICSCTVFLLLGNNLAGFLEPAVVSGGWMEMIVWSWGILLLFSTARWFRLDRRQRRGAP